MDLAVRLKVSSLERTVDASMRGKSDKRRLPKPSLQDRLARHGYARDVGCSFHAIVTNYR